MKTIVLIPSYEPTVEFIDIARKLHQELQDIVIVDDGSDYSYKHIFDEIESLGIIVLRHAVNLGKGRALKTGINYIANNYKIDSQIVTADSDGQHTIKDIKKVVNFLSERPTFLVLGSRDFDKSNVPLKSEFGNKMTRIVLSFFCGVKVTDTQTGLRGMSLLNAIKFLDIKGERFDFETNMLIESKEFGIEIAEVKIQTIYLNENKGTHFNPIKDSLQIYKVFAKYMFISLSSFIVDIFLFALLVPLLNEAGFINYILISTILARLVSSLFNYFMNCKTVFKGDTTWSTIIKYYILVFVQMFVSGLSVQFLNNILSQIINVVVIKLIIDMLLFAVNFYVQRELIFTKTKGEVK